MLHIIKNATEDAVEDIISCRNMLEVLENIVHICKNTGETDPDVEDFFTDGYMLIGGSTYTLRSDQLS